MLITFDEPRPAASACWQPQARAQLIKPPAKWPQAAAASHAVYIYIYDIYDIYIVYSICMFVVYGH